MPRREDTDLDRELLSDAVAVARFEKQPLQSIIRWPIDRPEFLVTVGFDDYEGGFECNRLQVISLTPGKPVDSAVLRSLPMGRLLNEAIEMQLRERLRQGSTASSGLGNKEITPHSAVRGRGRGRRYPPGHFERVAAVVRDARRDGRPITRAVAEAFGLSPSAAGNQISRARAQGLLHDETRGPDAP
jgi:hypothetical protein